MRKGARKPARIPWGITVWISAGRGPISAAAASGESCAVHRRLDMDACEVAASVTALAIALAQQLNDEQLNLLAAVLTQLGDTLNTILIQRDIVAGRQTPTV